MQKRRHDKRIPAQCDDPERLQHSRSLWRVRHCYCCVVRHALQARSSYFHSSNNSGVGSTFFRALARKYLLGQCLWVSAEEAFYFLPKVMPNNY